MNKVKRYQYARWVAEGVMSLKEFRALVDNGGQPSVKMLERARREEILQKLQGVRR